MANPANPNVSIDIEYQNTCTIIYTLCSRNFQNVKLRQNGVEILQFAATQILREMTFW